MHIVYLIKQPLLERDAERFGVNFMLARGYRITVIDLNDVIFPELAGGTEPYYDQLRAEVHVVRKWQDFWALKDLVGEADLAISLVRSYGLCTHTLPVFRLLSKVQTPYLIFAPLVDPLFELSRAPSRRPMFNRALSALTRLQPDEIADSVLSRIPFKYLGLPYARYVVYNGTASKFPNILVGRDTISIDAHAHDFELFIKTMMEGPREKNQAVFLDQNIPFHPDAITSARANRLRLVDPDVYYARLNDALDKIERELEIEVVIAAHPRADKSQTKKNLGQRKIVFNQTALTVAESQLALTHWSRSTNFAILFNKPIYFMVTQDLYEWTDRMPYFLDALCREIGTELHFYDDPKDLQLEKAFQFSEEGYRRYAAQFIKAPGSPNRPYWEIVMDGIEQGPPLELQ